MDGITLGENTMLYLLVWVMVCQYLRPRNIVYKDRTGGLVNAAILALI